MNFQLANEFLKPIKGAHQEWLTTECFFAFNSFFLASFCSAVLGGMGPSALADATAVNLGEISARSRRDLGSRPENKSRIKISDQNLGQQDISADISREENWFLKGGQWQRLIYLHLSKDDSQDQFQVLMTRDAKTLGANVHHRFIMEYSVIKLRCCLVSMCNAIDRFLGIKSGLLENMEIVGVVSLLDIPVHYICSRAYWE
ncbi:hypothetical protein Tco_0792221 [Tanacetum coccineum]